MATYNISYTAEQVQAAIGKKPIIQNRHWFVWNILTMQYEDTGVVAEGSDGSATEAAESAEEAKHWAEIAMQTHTASGISYDNAASSLDAMNVQDALDELSSEIVPIEKGGTGAATVAQALINLSVPGLTNGLISTSNLPTIPTNKGGTGATTISDARTNLSVYSKTEVDSLISPLSSSVSSLNSGKLNTVGKGVNLLDNWYFVGGGSQQGGGQFPINQRGSTSYATGYTIDRWKSLAATTTVSLTSESLRLTDSRINWLLVQEMKSVLIPGKTYTFSALYKAANARVRLVVSWGIGQYFYNEEAPVSSTYRLATITGTIPENATIDFEQAVVQSLDDNCIIDLQAIKLELGDTQTLARQENGQWVLNDPPPNYALELAKCNMSLADSDSYSNFPFLHIASGSYVGTGTTGWNNPNTLSFSFEPKLIWCSRTAEKFAADDSSAIKTLYIPLLSTEYQKYAGFCESAKADTWGRKSSDGKTIEWYSSSAINQLNASGISYYYTAIG